jgi:DNA polymerase-3 subunit alpha
VIRKFATHRLSDIQALRDGSAATIAVQVTKITKKVSKRSGQPFWIAVVEDHETGLEVFVTKEQHEAAGDALHVGALMFLLGKVHYRDTTPGLRIDALIPIDRAPAELTKDVSMVVSVENGKEAEDLIFRVKELLKSHRGRCPVYLDFRSAAGERAVLRVGEENFCHPDADFLEEVDRLCGQGRVFVNRIGNLTRY